MKSTMAIIVTLATAVLAACGARASGSLDGQWRFAEVRKAEWPPDAMTPPMFDIIHFGPSQTITLKNSLGKQAFSAKWAVRGDTITWHFQPADSPEPIEHALHYSFTRDGALVLRSAPGKHSSEQSVEWIYYRPERFLPPSMIAGEWTKDGGTAEDRRRFLPDGTVKSEKNTAVEEIYWGEYRLWRTADDHLMLTTLLWIASEGAFAMFEELEIKGTTMKMKGRVPPGIPEKAPVLWHRVGNTFEPAGTPVTP